MRSVQVNILNPKAVALLQNLADLKLIRIEENKPEGFSDVVQRLRKKASKQTPSLEDITREVEAVRAKRYSRGKG